MNTIIQIQARNQLAIIERILQTARVRGFALKRMEMNTLPDEAHLRLRLHVAGDRPVARLTTQLGKITGVLDIGALSAVDADPVEAAAG